MNKLLFCLLFAFVALGVIAQERTEHRMIIGIGNAEQTFFQQTIEFLNNIPEISDIKICESHRIIVFKLAPEYYRDDMEFLKFLATEIEGLVVYLKDDRILKNECYGEISKQ